MTPATKTEEENLYFAKRSHERRDAVVDEYSAASYSSGNAALKFGMLVNGGAVIALLGFVSSLLHGDLDQAEALKKFTFSLSFFAFGTGLSGLAAGFTNWRHFASARSEATKKADFEPPFIHHTETSQKWANRARLAQCLAVVFGAIAICLFFAGVFSVQSAILSFGAT